MGKAAKYVTRYALRLRKGVKDTRQRRTTHVTAVARVHVRRRKNRGGVLCQPTPVPRSPLNFSVRRKCRRCSCRIIAERAALLIKTENALATGYIVNYMSR